MKPPSMSMIHQRVFSTPDLRPAERMLALYLLGKVRRRPRTMSAKRIARDTGICRDTLPRYTRKLESLGLIRRERRRLGGAVTYSMFEITPSEAMEVKHAAP